jgi:hypothetical protein
MQGEVGSRYFQCYGNAMKLANKVRKIISD